MKTKEEGVSEPGCGVAGHPPATSWTSICVLIRLPCRILVVWRLAAPSGVSPPLPSTNKEPGLCEVT